MRPATFYYILKAIEPKIEKWQTTKIPISPQERLSLTLRFLSTGISYRSLSFSHRIAHSTISLIIKEVCEAIWDSLVEDHMPTPTQEGLKAIAENFYMKWGFPNCIGAIDGKHIRIKNQKNSGSMFYNYKQFFSIILQAVADANWKFIAIEVGGYGKMSDGGIFQSSNLGKLLESGEFNVPSAAFLPNTSIEAPFVLIGDEAYPLKTYLLRPFPKNNLNAEKEMFNDSLSKARKTIECAFGVIAVKWRILYKPLETSLVNSIIITKCICLLHNIIIDREGIDRSLAIQVESENNHRSHLSQTANQANNSSYNAITVRN